MHKHLSLIKSALAMAACAVIAGAALAQEDDVSATQWLAVIHGEMVEVADESIVVDANPNIIAFTDRPQRDVSLVNLEDFVEAAWGEDGFFVDDPPNAAVTSAVRDDLDTKIIEMTNVALDNTRMTISIVPLEGDMPGAGDQIILFVDGAGISGLVTMR